MPTKVKELRSITESKSHHNPNDCHVCGTTPKGRISASAVWARALRQPAPFKPFVSQGTNQLPVEPRTQPGQRPVEPRPPNRPERPVEPYVP